MAVYKDNNGTWYISVRYVNWKGEHEGKIGMTPAVELSYLKKDEQLLLIETIDSEQATPSLSQAQRIFNTDNLIRRKQLCML